MIQERAKERPILFSTPMVQALLEGKKTQTRRIVSEKLMDKYYEYDDAANSVGKCEGFSRMWEKEFLMPKCPYGQPGDILWVRETWRKYFPTDENGDVDWNNEVIEFAADNPEEKYLNDGDGFIETRKDGSERTIPWKPSIHMPKSACRLRLRITDIRVERLQEITVSDCFAEGAPDSCIPFMEQANGVDQHDWYKTLWQKINGEESWNNNPWVWVVSFEKI